tara:strand:- start:632 stop:829 length:198 start_codon:yes stop_codon:yes gene_type:complete
MKGAGGSQKMERERATKPQIHSKDEINCDFGEVLWLINLTNALLVAFQSQNQSSLLRPSPTAHSS